MKRVEKPVALFQQRLFPNGENSCRTLCFRARWTVSAVQNPEELFQYILQRNVEADANICRITPDMIVNYRYSEKCVSDHLRIEREQGSRYSLQPIYSLRGNKFTSAEVLCPYPRDLDLAPLFFR